MPTNSSNNSVKDLSKSVPTMDSSPLGKKKFRLFRRKSLFTQNSNLPQASSSSRRRSQSWDNTSHFNKLPHTPTSLIPDFKLRITIEEARHLALVNTLTNKKVIGFKPSTKTGLYRIQILSIRMLLYVV
jgi:hypothetical protein